ncbi:hypothetical protein SLS57_008673, partial [Botryosphaeria dothidea]
KSGKAFKSPILARRDLVVLPPSAISWLLQQSEDRVSQPKVMSQLIQSKYFLPALPKGEVIYPSIIKVDLNRHLALMTSAIVNEIHDGLAEHWGTDVENWKRINVFRTIESIAARISVRIFFGAELAYDAAFLSHSDTFSLLLTTSSGILAFVVPEPLRQFLGPLFALPARYYAWRMNRKLIPVIERRIAELSSTSSSKESEPTTTASPPNDILHHHIATALASPNPADRSPATIAARLQVILGFAAIPTTYLTLTNALLTLASLPATPSDTLSPDALLTLRAEAQRVLAAHDGAWTRTSLLSLVRADSFVKETMRLYPFSGRGLLHEVVAEEGVVLPPGLGPDDEEAVRVPKGTWFGVPTGEIQTDEEIYGKGAEGFEPWRFVDGNAGEERGSSATTTSDIFLSFSRGKHVCPGRFFAVNVMKLLLAHVAMEYDIKPLEKRPENVVFSDVSVPSDKAEIEVKRRIQIEE